MIETAYQFVFAAIAGGVALGVFAILLWQALPKSYNVALVNGAVGYQRTLYWRVGDHYVLRYDGQEYSAEPCAGACAVSVRRGVSIEIWRYFTISKAGCFEQPADAILALPKHILEEFFDNCVARVPVDGEGKRRYVVDDAAARLYAEHRGFDAQLVRNVTMEICKRIRGGDADRYAEQSWKMFLLQYRETIAFSAIAFLVLGVMLGTNMMLDPVFYSMMVSPRASWVMIGLVAVSTVLAVVGAKK